MADRPFQPGFRLSARDIIVLILGGLASAYAMTVDPWLGVAIAFVVLHFFLFCNVLRMSRPLELIWAGVFASLAVATVSLEVLAWPTALAAATLVTVVVAAIEMRRPSYHGVGWTRINPSLREWWETSKRHD